MTNYGEVIPAPGSSQKSWLSPGTRNGRAAAVTLINKSVGRGVCRTTQAIRASERMASATVSGQVLASPISLQDHWPCAHVHKAQTK
jgi:hypothetical protein